MRMNYSLYLVADVSRTERHSLETYYVTYVNGAVAGDTVIITINI